MSSTSQQLSQLVDSESLFPYMAYLCLCDTMFGGLATRLCTCVFSKHICFFTYEFLPYFLVSFVPFFLCLKGLVCANCSLS
jgi:hypothetical protein